MMVEAQLTWPSPVVIATIINTTYTSLRKFECSVRYSQLTHAPNWATYDDDDANFALFSTDGWVTA